MHSLHADGIIFELYASLTELKRMERNWFNVRDAKLFPQAAEEFIFHLHHRMAQSRGRSQLEQNRKCQFRSQSMLARGKLIKKVWRCKMRFLNFIDCQTLRLKLCKTFRGGKKKTLNVFLPKSLFSCLMSSSTKMLWERSGSENFGNCVIKSINFRKLLNEKREFMLKGFQYWIYWKASISKYLRSVHR